MNSVDEWPISPLLILEIPGWHLTALQTGRPWQRLFLTFLSLISKTWLCPKIRPPPLLYITFPVLNPFYLTYAAWDKDSNFTFKIIPVVTVHSGKLTNKDIPQSLSRISARKQWHRNVNFYFVVFLAYFPLFVITCCTSLWEKAHVNCTYCEIVSVITMETRLFLIVISDGNQEGNLRGWLSHEVSMRARPTHSSIFTSWLVMWRN
jgi:hypothetical protein